MTTLSVENFIDAGNVKFKTNVRESMYFRIRDKDDSGLLKSITNLFYIAFAIGYHFDKQKPIETKSINHTNLTNFDRSIKELMVKLILKRKSNFSNPKELWKEVETYAEYGITVLYNSWNEKKKIELKDILEN